MSSEETKVAVMQKQVDYISKQVDAILATLDKNLSSHQEQMTRFQTEMDKRFEGVYSRYQELNDKKADKTEVEKINNIFLWINRIIITAVIGAILALILTVK